MKGVLFSHLTKDHRAVGLTALEASQIEQTIGVMAKAFVGNLYSSFSRTIIEMRHVEGRSFATF